MEDEKPRIRVPYEKDPQGDGSTPWGHDLGPLTRRGFISRASSAALGAALGATIAYADRMPAGLMPIAFAQSGTPLKIPGKDPGLTVLNDRPINVETPAHLLDDALTPASRLFVRNNGIPPARVDVKAWTLEVAGEAVSRPLRFTMADLKSRFSHYSYQLVLECAGNGRKEFYPAAKGNQWSTGAVGCVEWTGVRLKDLLQACSLKQSAVYVAYEGADTHLSRDPKKKPISRGIPLRKAMEEECLIAWAMNGADIPILHGYPLRLVIPGFPGSCSGKWLTRLLIRDRVHDGAKMLGKAYRVPCTPVASGAHVSDSDMCIIEEMPTKSLITYPRSGIDHVRKQPLDIRGKAWSGFGNIAKVEVSIDFGTTWSTTELAPAKNRFAWQSFSHQVRFPKAGYYEIWARATDDRGHAQPMVLPGWNPKGYLNNACHRIAVRAV